MPSAAGAWKGTITAINFKTITVRQSNGYVPMTWRVSPALLRRAA